MRMRIWVGAVALAALAFTGCSRGNGATAVEPPPPPIEPALAPGSRLVDPRADELVRQMSDRLARIGAFALEAYETYDEVPEHSPRRQITNTRHVALRRPDRLAGAGLGAAIGAIADGGEGAAIGAAIGGAAGAGAAAAGSQTAAVIPAQSPESFTVSAPFEVDVMTNVAVR